MKKVLFTMLAALMMGAVITACSDKKTEKGADGDNTEAVEEELAFDEDATPADQLVGLTKQFVSVMKAAHINSEADAATLKNKIEKIQAKIEDVQKNMESSMEGLSDAEKLKMATQMLTLAKEFEGMEKEISTEVKRLQKEAAEAGVDIDDLDLE